MKKKKKDKKLLKISLIFASIVLAITIWTTTNTCNFNASLEHKKKQLEDLEKEAGHELGNMEITYYKKLDCSKKELNFDLQQMIDNFNAISQMLYQYITTDIKGNKIKLKNNDL